MTTQVAEDWDIEQSVGARFADQVERWPDNIAIRTPDAVLTYRELDLLSNRVAHSIPRSPERRPVAILCSDEIDFLAAQLGVLKAGRPLLPTHPTEPETRLSLILVESGADTVIITSGQATPGVGDGFAVIEMGTLAKNDGPLEIEVLADDPAHLQYTSGSTGVPKGVARSHRSVLAAAEGYVRALGITATDRLILVSRMFFLDTFGSFLTGAGLYPFDIRLSGVVDLPGWIHDAGVSVLRSPPSVIRALATQVGNRRLPDLRLVVQAGEVFSFNDLELFRSTFDSHTTLMHLYGSAEGGVVTTQIIDESFEAGEDALPVGPPVPGTEVTLIGDDGKPVPEGEQGVIAVASPSLAVGYFGRDDLTAERFHGTGAARRYVSGDIGRFDEQGRLVFLGRGDSQVKVRGYRVEIGEVESALHRVEGITEAVVVARSDAVGATQLIGYYSGHGEEPPSATDIRAEMSGQLPDYMIPSAWVYMQSFPINDRGKIDRRLLPEPFRPVSARSAGADVTSRMVGLWSDLLGVGDIGMGDSFFDLGGDSLAAAALMAAVEQEFGCRISMADLFEHETMEFMCAAVEGADPERTVELLFPIKPTGDLKPLYCLHMPGWSGFTYGSLARRMSSRRPMIGLLEHLDNEFPPDASLKETASRYADAIQHASDGPYHLLGTSAAGVVAYEIGRQLTERGAEVGFVGMIDSGYPSAFDFRRRIRAIRHHGAPSVVFGKLREAVDRHGVIGVPSLMLSRAAHRLRLRRTADGARLERARRVKSAYHHHRVELFDAAVTYFQASEGEDRSAAATRWRPFVSEIVEIDGAHHGPDSVLSAHHAAGLARALESALAGTEKKVV